MIRLLTVLGCWLLTGCGSSSSTGSEDAASAPGTLDDSRIEAAAVAYKGFAKLNKDAYKTQQHAGNPFVNVYANPLAEERYRMIEPGGDPPAAFNFPAGSILVKEMLDPSGPASVLTVMYKKAAGYDPSHQDWWYGRLKPDGTPTNPEHVGLVDFCISCHSGTAEWDYAWGVTPANRTSK